MSDDEFARIERLRRRLGGGRAAPEGIGDDGAVLRADDGRVIVMDTIVEGTHFRLDWSTWTDAGYRLVSTNVSDLWAMGAEPTAMLLSLSLPRGTSPDVVDAIADGMAAACDALDVAPELVGGDTTTGVPGAVLSLTLIGASQLERTPVRSGARPGQGVWCVGALGRAAAGVAALTAGRADGTFGAVAQAHHRPTPPVPDHAALRLSVPTAMIDVSDGLSSDVWHVARASNVAIELDAAALEPDADVQRVAAALGGDPVAWVWHGGDDYARVATCDIAPGPAWRRIGAVVGDGASLTVVDPDGTRHSIEARGYRHA